MQSVALMAFRWMSYNQSWMGATDRGIPRLIKNLNVSLRVMVVDDDGTSSRSVRLAFAVKLERGDSISSQQTAQFYIVDQCWESCCPEGCECCSRLIPAQKFLYFSFRARTP